MPTHFDFIFAGGGAAALSLLYRMLDEPRLKEASILVIDRERKNKNDRTWCFWTDEPTPFDAQVYRQWEQIRIVSQRMDETFRLKRLKYKMLRGIDFYNCVFRKAAQFPNVTFLQAEVKEVRTTSARQATVFINDEQSYTANWVFDSRFHYHKLKKQEKKFRYLLQHFKGWVIRTEKPAFTPKAITMFDFRTPQPDGLYFFYTLPFSATEALVEYTAFSPSLLENEEAYVLPLRAYIREQLGIRDFEVLEEEYGVIPMTNHRFSRQPSPRVMRLGIAAGQAKPSTGYAFLRAQRDADRIVRSLQLTGSPFFSEPFSGQFWLYDTLMLDIMARKGERIKPLFEQLFQRNPIDRLLLFLDERTGFQDDLRVMASVPPLPFLEALVRTGVRILSP